MSGGELLAHVDALARVRRETELAILVAARQRARCIETHRWDSGPVEDQQAWLAGVFDRAAPTYDRIGEAYHSFFAERMIDLVDPARDVELLDVACGRGAVLLAAAAVGVERLTGIDMSPAMIELAEVDLRAADVARVDLHVMDAHRLDFPDASFDVVTAAFALFFLPDPARATAEFRRVLRPKGTVAVSTWGDEDDRWAFEDDLLPRSDSPRVRALQHPFDQAEDVTALLESAGFTDLAVQHERIEIHFESPQQWWDWHWSFSVRGLLEQLGPQDLEKYREGCFTEMDAIRTADGYPMRLEALIVTGRAAGSRG
jgi:ubiquinone/menaquinone biosynthesis C-methylase UbiE